MSKQEFIEWLESEGYTYQDVSDLRSIDTVFVYDGEKYRLDKSINGKRKKKIDIYVPYIRVSHFDERENMVYSRDSGMTGWHYIEDQDWSDRISKEELKYNGPYIIEGIKSIIKRALTK